MPGLHGRLHELIRVVASPIKLSNDGTETGSVTYHYAPYLEGLAAAPGIGAPHPDKPTLLLYERDTDRLPGGDSEDEQIAVITCHYKGLEVPDNDNETTSTVREVTVSGSAEPIETNPRYESVSDENHRLIKEAISNGWSSPGPLDATSLELFYKLAKGNDRYLRPQATFRLSYVAKSLPSLSGVGTIANPSGAPSLSSGENWLFAGANARQEGGVVSVSKEYQASGPGGWDPDLYS